MDEKRVTRLNQPLGWNDTGCLRTRHTDFAKDRQT
jgi:hypothetical protein